MDQAAIPVFFYDPLQAVKPSSLSKRQFYASVGEAAKDPISLTEQMRCKGGLTYLDYVRDIIWGEEPEPMQFDDYAFELHEDFSSFHACFEKMLAKYNLTRMVAGFAWSWTTKKQSGNPPMVFDMEIEGIRLKWNCVRKDWVDLGLRDPNVAREVGCIHTIQGYDLSNAFVIVGPDLTYDPVQDELVADRASYFDKNGKNRTSDKELLDYLRRIYYVLLTRGIEGTHVYIYDENLRNHLRRFFVQGA